MSPSGFCCRTSVYITPFLSSPSPLITHISLSCLWSIISAKWITSACQPKSLLSTGYPGSPEVHSHISLFISLEPSSPRELTTNKSSEADLLNGLLGWIRNEAFGKIAEACALWGAIVQANKHLAKVDRETCHALYLVDRRCWLGY